MKPLDVSPQKQAAPVERGSFQIPSLDGLRAVSFLIVFLAHAGLDGIIPAQLGLAIFFFLSGYLITTLLRLEHERDGGISLKQFYLRRVLRIFPPFYLVLSVASALTLMGALEGRLHWGAVGAQLLQVSNYYIVRDGWWNGRAPGTWVYWSLAVEEHFYLVFPLLYLFLQRTVRSPRRQMLVLLGLCAAVLAWRCVLIFALHAGKDRTYVATDTRVDAILFGCILAIHRNPALDRARISQRCWKALGLPLGGALLFLAFAIRDARFQETLRYTLESLALFPLFVVAIRSPDWGPFRLLNVRWFRFVGTLSYSLYLMHTTVLYLAQQWLPWHPALRGLLALGVSVLLAGLIYHLVEKPCARLRKRLSGRGMGRRPPTSEASDSRPWQEDGSMTPVLTLPVPTESRV